MKDPHSEEGGLGLTLDSDSAEFLEGRVGVAIAAKKDKGFVPFASVDYAYDFGSDPLAVAASFNGGADNFTIVADEASASRFDVGVGADFVSDDKFSIGAEYRGRFASGYQSHSGGIRLRFAF
ncbi:MAG: autotransporter outer membrane beta-barrel domain-containing protein [Pseudomonadota bacterium]